MANYDENIDLLLRDCVTKEKRKSFFLFAGAGSGKTYSLVNLLAYIKDTWGESLMREHRQVAVITYTNAATDEIMRRIDYSPLFHVSTIHSFLWDVIKPFQIDIKKIYLIRLQESIDELAEKLAKSKKKNGVTYSFNEEKYNRLSERMAEKERISKFIYNPNGDNLKANSLNHQDVIDIGITMMRENAILQKIIVQQYPFMLIDESQDTKSGLVDVFFEIQGNHRNDFTLGFIGDIKQRIYMDGKVGIKDMIPEEWEQPVKQMNYRSAKRIVEVANNISTRIDGTSQKPRENASEGYARLFLVENKEGLCKSAIETKIREVMKEVTHDERWIDDVKILTIEHRMAAVRLGFQDFFDLFNKVPKYKMSFLQGEIPEMAFFSKNLFQLLAMIREGNETGILHLLKHSSPLLEAVKDKDYPETLKKIKKIVEELKAINDNRANVNEIIGYVNANHLFILPDIIMEAHQLNREINEDDSCELKAWVAAMKLPVSQLEAYDDYVHDRTCYATHQGVKGLQFPRVLVLIDDNEANGNLFSYDKLFDVVPLSDTDIKNKKEGKENSIDRTARLFYVTCTRAEDSLAILMYTNNPEIAKETAINNNWFKENEIDILT